ncbi:SH3 domain-containing protein [Moraxella sp. VT-16-12]|uniref:SH3 domain-containing protein n=1 Tax=Moraxella sp. VT-16-12 TaxID=2014877 RepID=UPI000B7FBF44|nr:SH3 domain-containing protein [Moraxella sp. VT-16-12]
MKKPFLITSFMALFLMFQSPVFGKCVGWGEFVPPKTQNFKQLQGIWVFEQEETGIFEIRLDGKSWVLVQYHFDEGDYSKIPIKTLKNGTFLKRTDGLYQGYDAQIKEIVLVDDKGCRVTGSARLSADDVHIIYSPEGHTNVRRGASNKHAIIRQIPNGTKIVLAEYSKHNHTNSNWKEVLYFNYDKNLIGTGFVHQSQFR